MAGEQLREKFLGSLVGTAVGDAIGASREGRRMARGHELRAIAAATGPLHYTDDTHMTIGVAESLLECRGFNGAHMAACFIRNYRQEPWRGYGPGPPRVFRLIENGEPWDKAASTLYPGGSFGNGSAMRVAPVGLLFWQDAAQLKEVAYQSSLITHAHVLGKEGAALQARAVALAVAESPGRLDRAAYLAGLSELATQSIYRERLGRFSYLLEHPEDRDEVVRELGNGIEAFNSVPTAIFSFLSHAEDFASAVIYAVSLGGDTDTIAAMAGAISGAYLGIRAIPTEWQEQLENRSYLMELADRLWRLALQLR